MIGVVKSIFNNQPVVYKVNNKKLKYKYDLVIGIRSYFVIDWYYVGSANNVGKFEDIIAELGDSKDEWKVINTETNEECKQEIFY